MNVKTLVLLAAMTLILAEPNVSWSQQTQPGQAYNLRASDQKQFNALPKSQRNELLQQSYKKWQGMSATEKKTMEEQASSEFYALSAAEQKKIKANALQQWQSMSPEEQDELRSTFPDMLKGDLELDPGS